MGHKSKVSIIVFDKKLDLLSDKVLFPEKPDRAKKLLAHSVMPKKGIDVSILKKEAQLNRLGFFVLKRFTLSRRIIAIRLRGIACVFLYGNGGK
jgi:hypothetical protein